MTIIKLLETVGNLYNLAIREGKEDPEYDLNRLVAREKSGTASVARKTATRSDSREDHETAAVASGDAAVAQGAAAVGDRLNKKGMDAAIQHAHNANWHAKHADPTGSHKDYADAAQTADHFTNMTHNAIKSGDYHLAGGYNDAAEKAHREAHSASMTREQEKHHNDRMQLHGVTLRNGIKKSVSEIGRARGVMDLAKKAADKEAKLHLNSEPSEGQIKAHADKIAASHGDRLLDKVVADKVAASDKKDKKGEARFKRTLPMSADAKAERAKTLISKAHAKFKARDAERAAPWSKEKLADHKANNREKTNDVAQKIGPRTKKTTETPT